MNRKMSGFVDPYSLGLIISLAAVIVIQFTQKELPDEVIASHPSEVEVKMSVPQELRVMTAGKNKSQERSN